MSGGKSGGAGQQYNYYGTIAGAVCAGPVDELVAIIMDGEEVWPSGYAWYVGLHCTVGTPYVFDGQTWTCTTAHVATGSNAPGSGLEGWTEFTFRRGSTDYNDFRIFDNTGKYYGLLRLYWGTQTQAVDGILQSTGNNKHDGHPNYAGICYIILIDFLLGQTIQSSPNVEIIVRKKATQSLIGGSPALITDGQCNLAAAAVEVLTDPNMINLPATVVDTTSFNTVAGILDANELLTGASVLLDKSDTLRSVFGKFADMMDGFSRYNPSTKLVELGVYQHGVIPATYTTLTADAMAAPPKFTTKSWQETYSRATINFMSRQLNYQQSSEKADDSRAFAVLGQVRDAVLERPFLCRPDQARLHGRETLRVVGHAVLTGIIQVRRELCRTIRAGDYVFVDVDLEPNGATIYQFFRVKSRRIPPTGPMTLELQAENTIAPIAYASGYVPIQLINDNVPPITTARFLEVPTILGGQRGSVICLAQRSSNVLIGAQVYFDTAHLSAATVSSIVADGTGLNGIITFNTAPGYGVGEFIDVAGATNAAFNVSLAQITAVSGNTVTYVLSAPVTASLAASGTLVVLDYYNTFSSLGVFPTFAALATLNADVAATDATITVNVDTTQADAAYFTQSLSALDQANDTMLAILVQKITSGTDAGQIAESGGYAIMEIMSVGTQTLVSAGQYTLAVLRARQNTLASAFTAAATEVWLIPRALVVSFLNASFDVIRANRITGMVPAYAQFRLCPYTYVAELPLSQAANINFHFALNSASAPTLNLTSPGSFSVSKTGVTVWPVQINILGSWSDPDGNLVETTIKLRSAAESTDRVVQDNNFSPCFKKTLTAVVQIEKAGSYTIKLIARDSTNLVTERDIAVVIAGSGNSCAFPQVFDMLGNQLVNASGSTPSLQTLGYYLMPESLVPIGPLTLTCTTPAANIYFWGCPYLLNGVLQAPSPTPVLYVAGSCQPVLMLIETSNGNSTYTLSTFATFSMYAKAAGYTQSATVAVKINTIYSPGTAFASA